MCDVSGSAFGIVRVLLIAVDPSPSYQDVLWVRHCLAERNPFEDLLAQVGDLVSDCSAVMSMRQNVICVLVTVVVLKLKLSLFDTAVAMLEWNFHALQPLLDLLLFQVHWKTGLLVLELTGLNHGLDKAEWLFLIMLLAQSLGIICVANTPQDGLDQPWGVVSGLRGTPSDTMLVRMVPWAAARQALKHLW